MNINLHAGGCFICVFILFTAKIALFERVLRVKVFVNKENRKENLKNPLNSMSEISAIVCTICVMLVLF